MSTSSSPIRRRFLPAVALVALLSATACEPADQTAPSQWSHAPASTASSAGAATAPSPAGRQAAPEADYSHLLLQAADLTDHEDTFAPRSASANPGGAPGASALFVNSDDTRAISDTVALYPDNATASATLREAVSKAGTVVSGGAAEPSPVGTDGTVIRGTSPDGTKAVTLLLFTEGRALARLEFQSATFDPTTDQFVTNIGKMQQIALRIGQPAAE